MIKTTTDRSPWSLPHLNYLKLVYLKFYNCTLLHMITSLDLKQNTLLTCIFFMNNELSNSYAGCYINDECINHIMYADDICLMAPTATAMQNLLDVCHNY